MNLPEITIPDLSKCKLPRLSIIGDRDGLEKEIRFYYETLSEDAKLEFTNWMMTLAISLAEPLVK